MKKVFLGVGHGGSDPGAVGYVIEEEVNLNMALACRDYLVANGIEVRLSRTVDENDDLNDEINECNIYNPDLAVDIHNNAGGGDGFEVFHTIKGGIGKTLAENIEKEVVGIGQNSRGVKTRYNSSGTADYYGFIRNTKVPAVITEGAFVDNATDVQAIDTLEEQKVFGEAIAKGILKTLGISSTNTPTVTQTPQLNKPMYVRVNSVLNVRSGAGTNYGVVRTLVNNTKVTVIEESNGWSRIGNNEWVSSTYLAESPASTTVSSKYKLGLYVVNTSKGLNVRSGPGTNYSIVKTYINGTRFDTYEIKDNWAKTPSGWVCLDYCRLINNY